MRQEIVAVLVIAFVFDVFAKEVWEYNYCWANDVVYQGELIDSKSATSLNECEDHCDNMKPDCKSVTFNFEHNNCSVYDESAKQIRNCESHRLSSSVNCRESTLLQEMGNPYIVAAGDFSQECSDPPPESGDDNGVAVSGGQCVLVGRVYTFCEDYSEEDVMKKVTIEGRHSASEARQRCEEECRSGSFECYYYNVEDQYNEGLRGHLCQKISCSRWLEGKSGFSAGKPTYDD